MKVSPLQAKNYINLIHRGASPAYSKIRNDTFRTLTTDILFQRRVSETSLIRLLNALAWLRWDEYHSRRQHGQIKQLRRESHQRGHSPGLSQSRILSSTSDSTNASSEVGNIAVSELYVQGLNVLAAPFLYTCNSETQAFALLDTFVHTCCPLYLKPMLDGVHLGLKILDACLQIIDPTLYTYLKSKLLTAELYGFACMIHWILFELDTTLTKFIPSGAYDVGMYASTQRSANSLGFSDRVWTTYEYPCGDCSASFNSRFSISLEKVSDYDARYFTFLPLTEYLALCHC